MSIHPPATSSFATQDISETHALLQRIVAAVENRRGRGRLELFIAIVLSVATFASTWCGYQARQWGSAASSSQMRADTAERQSAENTIVALQLRTQDGLILLEYWRALRADDQPTMQNILAHMRPMVRTSLEAALASGVLTNPQLPGPLQRPEYQLPQEQEAALQRVEAAEHRSAAASASKAAGEYILLTLVFASVLFFGGISATFTERRIRMSLAGVALALCAVTVILLIGMPIYREI